MSNDSLRICYFPGFEDSEELNEQVTRACFYLACLKPAEMLFTTTFEGADLKLRPHYDPTIEDTKVRLVEERVLQIQEGGDLDQAMAAADIIICWQGKHKLGEKLKQLESSGTRVFDVDRSHRMEGSLYIDIVNKLFTGTDAVAAESHAKLSALAQEHAGNTNAFLFCTGPSVAEYSNYDFSDGISIVCNSVINDSELMDRVQPKLHVFADPIFHFGCSRYAYEFRKSLVEASRRYDLIHVIPMKYWALFCSQVPELADSTIAVPFNQTTPINYALDDHFVLRTTDNILTFLMLPLAGTLARKIFLLGCDGRPLEEDDYFWKHNPKTQFVGEMENIQLAHPSFFKLDYNEYYLRHCDRLEEYFQAGEAQKKRFISLSFSHIPALINREFPFRAAASAEELWLSINPDLENNFGHFYHMDQRIRAELDAGKPLISLVKRDALEKPDGNLVPTFSDNTWHLRDTGREASSISQRFKNELTWAAMDLRLLPMQKLAFIYTADIEHLAVILDAIGSLTASRVEIHVNLFYASFDIFKAGFPKSSLYARYRDVLERCKMRRRSNLHLYVESRRTRQQLKALFDFDVQLWPMICTTPVSDLDTAARQSPSNKVPTVLIAGTSQYAKGTDVACYAILNYIEIFGQDVRFLMRDLPKDSLARNEALRRLIRTAASHECVELFEGTMSNADYAAMFSRADVVVLPYRAEAFYGRTSAALVDALFFSGQVIVTEDSWLSDEISGLPGTHTFIDGDDNSLVRVIRKATRMQLDSATAAERHELWKQRYSPRGLINRFHETADEIMDSASGKVRADLEVESSQAVIGFERPSMQELIQKLGDRPTSDSTKVREEVLNLREELRSRLSRSEIQLNGDMDAKATDLRSRLDDLIGTLDTQRVLAQVTRDETVALREVLAGSTERIASLETQVSEISAEMAQFASLRKQISRMESEFESQHGRLSTLINSECATLKDSLSDLQRLHQQLLASTENGPLARSINGLSESLSGRFTQLEETISTQQALLMRRFEEEPQTGTDSSPERERITNRLDQLEKAEQQVSSELAQQKHSNRSLYQRFSRTVTHSDLNTLMNEWLPKLNITKKKPSLAYEADTICSIESNCEGRLASSVQDILLRSLVVRAVPGSKLDYLEIGTLFGINLVVMHELGQHQFKHMHLMSIDPLENYYEQTEDVLTGLPITSGSVERNLKRYSVSSKRVDLIKALSSDEKAIAAARGRKLNCILIDGDHTLLGIRNDHVEYLPALSPGGYMIVDDYRAEEWPDVTRYVDEEMKKDERLEWLGASFRTAVFRAAASRRK